MVPMLLSKVLKLDIKMQLPATGPRNASESSQRTGTELRASVMRFRMDSLTCNDVEEGFIMAWLSEIVVKECADAFECGWH